MADASNRKQELRRLMAALDNQPISPSDPRYFNFAQAPGKPRGDDPIENLRTIVQLGESGSTCQLFSGFRGSGKSTELNRLGEELRSDGFYVVFVKGGDVLNLHQPLEPSDLLVSVAAGVAEAIDRATGASPAARSLGARIAEFFTGTNVNLSEVGVGLGVQAGKDLKLDLAQLKLQLTKNPSFKARVQGALRHKFAEFEGQLRRFMLDAKKLLEPHTGGRSPVLIVDDLEKIRGTGADQDIIQKGMEQIFWEFARSLHVEGWHAIWTAPPYPQLVNASLANDYDGSFVLPMVRVWGHDDERSPDEIGLRALRGCLKKRGDIDSLFLREELLDQIILTSSGHLRDLLRLIQDAVRDVFKQPDPTVPLNERAVARIIDDYERESRAAVFDEDLPWLRTVAQSRTLRLPDQDMVQRVSKLLDTSVVMTYRNGAMWVDVSRSVQKLL